MPFCPGQHRVTAVLCGGLAVFILGCLPLGCGDERKSTSPDPPAPAGHALAGSVSLRANLTNELGEITAVDQIDDADGVRVLCRHAGGECDTAMTVGGHYHFGFVPAGICTLEVLLDSGHRLSHTVMEMPAEDHHLHDALVLEASPALRIYPNPPHEEGAGIEFTTVSQAFSRTSVFDLSGALVWSYEQTAPPGFYHVHWSGTDAQNHPVNPGPYWVVVEMDGVTLAGLVLWGHEHEHEGEGEGNCGHIIAEGILLRHHDEVLASTWGADVEGTLEVESGSSTHGLEVAFLREDHSIFVVADSCSTNRLTWTVADSSVAAVRPIAGSPWAVRVFGKTAGRTSVAFRAWHEEHYHFESAAIPIEVR